jgi:hypothetical protein
MSPDLETLFPGLRTSGYVITSPKADAPNCIGWALRSSLFFDPKLSRFIGGYYWPEGAPREDTLAAWMAVFELHGYRLCETADLEPGAEKIAIYADQSGDAQHVARQLPSGAWTSKIGKLQDIEHTALDGLVGDDFGTVAAIMTRPRRG